MSRRLRSRATAGVVTALGGLLIALVPGSVALAEPVENLYTDQIDHYADYDAADSCSPTDKPGAVALKALVLNTYPGTSGYISRACTGGTSEHEEGRAFDWMVSADTQGAIADDLLDWLLADDSYGGEHAMARRFGVMYIIWDHQIWRAYDADDGWQTYSGSNPHTDHVHISMSWDGALKETTWFTGVDLGMRMDQARFAAAWSGPERYDVFRRGKSGDIEQRTWAGSWGEWDSIDGRASSGPAAVWAKQTLWVFARGEDGNLHWRMWRKETGWDPWEETTIEISAAPGAASLGKRVDLVVRTPTGSVEHRSWKPKSGWSDPRDLGGVVSAPPAIVWRSPGWLDLVARGTNGRLYQQSMIEKTWTQWVDRGGFLTAGPAATSIETGRTDVFLRTDKGTIAYRYDLGAGFTAPGELGGRHVSGPAAGALRGTQMDVYTRDRSGSLNQKYYRVGYGWSGWELR